MTSDQVRPALFKNDDGALRRQASRGAPFLSGDLNDYIHRYGDFSGFFTRNNVAALTQATGKQW